MGDTKSKPALSRIIDGISEALGHQAAFTTALAFVIGWLAGIPFAGLTDHYQLVANTPTTLVTFIMVFAVQHTANQDARAMHVKLDELIRSSDARDRLIGAEQQAPTALKAEQAELHEQAP